MGRTGSEQTEKRREYAWKRHINQKVEFSSYIVAVAKVVYEERLPNIHV
jgi:hypothetical protein